MPNLKEFFIREAAGITGDVPKLLKGEALSMQSSASLRTNSTSAGITPGSSGATGSL